MEGRAITNKPVKQSVALAVRRRGNSAAILLVRRPDDDDEFPGMWGLPAASCRDGEGLLQAARRIGVQKLGTPIEIGQTLATGAQERENYLITMSLVEAFLGNSTFDLIPPSGPLAEKDGVTMYTEFEWGKPSDLTEAAAGGSLCSQLLLRSMG